MNKQLSACIFVLFFISGFCGLLYQTIWLRLAFAAFGVITPVLSVVVSVFMLGLALGSWWGGCLIKRLSGQMKVSALVFYAGTEGIIGLSAFAVPWLFSAGRELLLGLGQSNSIAYMVGSALCIALSLLPWCFCMGTTFPFMMAFIKERGAGDTRSFSGLYLSNCLGAMFGTILTAVVLIEMLGFRQVLFVGAAGNFLIALTSLILSRRQPAVPEEPAAEVNTESAGQAKMETLPALMLFATGFASMAMEVVWTREFLYVIGTEVYAFAELLFAYLLAMCVGSYVYRKDAVTGKLAPLGLLFMWLALVSILPLVLNDPLLGAIFTGFSAMIYQWCVPSAPHDPSLLFHPVTVFTALASITPCSYLFGYITPRVIDEYAGGGPKAAGAYYAVNTVGCILGPLAASYFLLPLAGSKHAIVMLSVPFLLFAIPYFKSLSKARRWCQLAALAAAFLMLPAFVSTYEELPSRIKVPSQVRRDYAATVVAFGTGRQRNMMVNGDHVTSLNQCVKDMAHIPLALHTGKPEKALVICFGMGTTFRSLMSWPLDVTAVELVPSVVKSFPFFHANAAELLADTRAHALVDDGRRFLSRSSQSFDLIAIDPSPVMEKGCMSLLFSEEFMQLAKKHLRPGGILQFFFAEGEERTCKAVFRTISGNFKYLRVFNDPGNGFFCFASDSPLNKASTAEQVFNTMPATAQKDMLEWLPAGGDDRTRLLRQINWFFDHEIALSDLLDADLRLRITDDKPINEYHLLRNFNSQLNGSYHLLKPPFHYLQRP